VVAGLIVSTTIVRADVDRHRAELLIRELMPAAARCQTSPVEPLFLCRYQTESPQSIALEIGADFDGYYGSLTFSIGDEFGRDAFQILERFVSKLGVEQDAFMDCIHQSLWQSAEISSGNLRLACRHVEIGHRVTQEIFVLSR
jgi:hypothetical protein